MGAVAPQGYQAIKAQLLVVGLHLGYFIYIILPHHPHFAKGGAAGAQYGAAHGEDVGELRLGHLLIVAFYQPAVAAADADNLGIKQGIGGTGYAADGSVEARAIATAGQYANSSFHGDPFCNRKRHRKPMALYIYLMPNTPRMPREMVRPME